MISRNRARRSRRPVLVEQRLDVAADRRQRRAQLVRDVGDEVAPDLIGAPQIGDVVQHQHRAAAAARRHRRGARHERPARVARQRQLAAVDAARRAAPPPAARRCRDGGSLPGTGRPTADASTRSISCAARLTSCRRPCRSTTSTPSTMPERIASIRARSRDSSSSRAPELLHRRVEHARHGAELVGAVVVARAASGRPRRTAAPRRRSRCTRRLSEGRESHASATRDRRGERRTPAARRAPTRRELLARRR